MGNCPMLRVGNMHYKKCCMGLLRWIPKLEQVPTLHPLIITITKFSNLIGYQLP